MPSAQPNKSLTTSLPDRNMIIQVAPPEYQLLALPLPRLLVKDDIPATLRFSAEGDGIIKIGVFGQPLHGFLVVAPVAVRELNGGELLHDVAHHGVKDVEESFVGEGANLLFERVHIENSVAGGKGKGWGCGVRGAVGERASEGGPEGSKNN